MARSLNRLSDREARTLRDGICHVKHLAALFDELERLGIKQDFWDAFRTHHKAADIRIERQAERDMLRRHGLAWRD